MNQEARRHVHGAVLIVLGAWEALAFTGKAPTITRTARTRKWLRPLWLAWLILIVRHLWSE